MTDKPSGMYNTGYKVTKHKEPVKEYNIPALIQELQKLKRETQELRNSLESTNRTINTLRQLISKKGSDEENRY